MTPPLFAHAQDTPALPSKRLAAAEGIVSLSVCTDGYVLAVADASQIKAVSYLSQDPLYSPYAAKAHGLVTHGGKADEILALNPKVVIGGIYTSPFLMDALKKSGATLVTLPEAETFSQIEDNLRRVGELLGQESRTQALIQDHQKRVDAVKKASETLPPRTALFFRAGGWSVPFSPLTTEVWNMAKLSAPQGLSRGMTSPSLEKLLSIRPNIVLRESLSQDFHSLDENFPLKGLLDAAHIQSLPFPTIWGLCDSPHTIEDAAALQNALQTIKSHQ